MREQDFEPQGTGGGPAPKALAPPTGLYRPPLLPLLLGLLLGPLVCRRSSGLRLPRHLCTSGLRRFCLRLVGLGHRHDDGQHTDELEDGPQEESIPQQVLQKRGLGHLGRGEAPAACCPRSPPTQHSSKPTSPVLLRHHPGSGLHFFFNLIEFSLIELEKHFRLLCTKTEKKMAEGRRLMWNKNNLNHLKL